MNSTMKQGRWAAILALACGLALPSVLHAGDPGELFPNVAPYDETVSSPISKPERAVNPPPVAPAAQNPAPAPLPAPPLVTPVTPPPVAPAPPPPSAPGPVAPPPPPPPDANGNPAVGPNDLAPAANPNPRIRQPRIPDGTMSPVAPPPPPPPMVEMNPLATGLLKPILSPDDEKVFHEQYADSISKALAGSVDLRRKTAQDLDAAAETAPTAALKRYLLLNAFALYIRASTPLLERVQKVETLLPLLTERTLPVVQARADALNDLMLTASSNPNERFMDLYINAHATLAKLQVQAGFPKDAQESLKKAREVALHHTHKSQARIDQINEAAAWCDRSNTAMALWPKFQAILKTKPDDPYTNTMMAILHLSLYGNLDHAAPFAAKSDRKELQNLAQVLKANPPGNLSPEPSQHADQVLAIAAALVDVAKSVSGAIPFDRYSIACYAGDRVSRMLADGVVPADKTDQAKALLASAKDVIDKTNLKRGEDLPKWLGGDGGTGIAGGKAMPARSMGSIADIFRGIPKELAPTEVGWTDKQMDAVNDWLAKNVVGQAFDGSAQFDRIRPPVDSDDGKIFVPIMMMLPAVDLTEGVSVRASIEDHVSVKLAVRAKSMRHNQETNIKGQITSAKVSNWGDARREHLEIIITNKDE